MPSFKPYEVARGEWPVPKPANDNALPVITRPQLPKTLRPADFLQYIGRGSGLARAIELGIMIGSQRDYIPNLYLATNGFYSYCPQPGGYGAPMASSLVYFPGGFTPGVSPRIQVACQSAQALPGGGDGLPNPTGDANGLGVGWWRYSNLARTRYTHVLSLKNARIQMDPVQVLPGYRQAISGRMKDPPLPSPPKGKEKKFIITGNLARALSFLTEVGDVVDCLFSSLPGKVKAAAYGFYNGRLGKGAKAMVAYYNFHDINWLTFSACAAANQVEDAVYGRLGRLTGRANRKRGNLAGLTVGPAL